MEIKKESIPGTAGVMMGDMDGIIGCPDPQATLARLIEGEQMEAALYEQIAQCIPSEQLKCIIMNKAGQELRTADLLRMISGAFTAPPVDPPGVPGFFGVSEKEKKQDESK
ncbi:MAG TPA: hypothetical protein PK728_03135 [Bacillota bacterium]|nr:hypothetical protein [Bacillota bacterium]